jgi:heme o synthase
MAFSRTDPQALIVSTAGWRDHLELTKPKVILLIVFTAITGMVLASPEMVPWPALVFGTVGIAMASGSAAALNHIFDQRIDNQMARTRLRALPTGRLRTSQSFAFTGFLGVGAMPVPSPSGGGLCALLMSGSLVGYAVIYTLRIAGRSASVLVFMLRP